MRCFITALLCVFIIQVSAQETRKYSNEFLYLGAGARALGMGKTQVSLVQDATAGYWNPAGLVRAEKPIEVALMHSEYFAGIANYDFGAASLKISDKGALGFSIIRFGVDDIPNTLELVDENGAINYDRVTSFSAADYAGLISYSRKFNEYWSGGANVKIIHRTVGPWAKAWGFGLDAGVQYKKNNISFGAIARDITQTFNAWSFSFTEEEKRVLLNTGNIVPSKSVEVTAPRLVIGGAWLWDISEKVDLLFSADIETTFDGKRNTLLNSNTASIAPRAGMELGLWDVFYLRTGIHNFQKQTLVTADENNYTTTFEPNLGAGVNIAFFTLDYAFTNIGQGNNQLFSHVVSVIFKLERSESK